MFGLHALVKAGAPVFKQLSELAHGFAPSLRLTKSKGLSTSQNTSEIRIPNIRLHEGGVI
jgi:hypothetical protein